MGETTGSIKSIAPLTNVGLMASLVERVMQRADGLPGLATFHGFSGYGKSFAATYAANSFDAALVQVKSVWTRKYFCTQICRELELRPAKTIPEMVDQIGEELAKSGRLLILDEADHVVARGMIELVRDLYETGQTGIVLIGEEHLPAKLQGSERVHGRVLSWVAAQPVSLSDTRDLTRLYCPGVAVAEDLVKALHEASRGSVRRVCVNLNRVAERASVDGAETISLAEWGDEPWYDGEPPKRRS